MSTPSVTSCTHSTATLLHAALLMFEGEGVVCHSNGLRKQGPTPWTIQTGRKQGQTHNCELW